MQDYIRQKDKYSFQEAQIRKLAFELEQMRAMRANIPVISSAGYKDEEKQSLQLLIYRMKFQ